MNIAEETIIESGTKLYYDYLTEHGKKQLNFILLDLNRYHKVERLQFVAHLANILLIFMPPWEVYSVLL